MDDADGLEPLAALMRLSDGDARPAERRLRDHYTYVRLAGRDAAPGHEAGNALAAEHFGRAAALADGLASYTESKRTGLREKQAYELHEVECCDEAPAVDRDVLATGERLSGARGSKLKAVPTNLVQNLHALGRKGEAEPYLAASRVSRRRRATLGPRRTCSSGAGYSPTSSAGRTRRAQGPKAKGWRDPASRRHELGRRRARHRDGTGVPTAPSPRTTPAARRSRRAPPGSFKARGAADRPRSGRSHRRGDAGSTLDQRGSG